MRISLCGKIFFFIMWNLFILNEISTNGMSYNSLTVISLVSVLCGISIIVSRNPIVSVLFLIGLFISIAGYLMMLGINFIGLSYLLVYVGAVSILFLFILMLINVRISELVTENNNSIPLAIIITGIVGTNQFSPALVGMPVMMVGSASLDGLFYKFNVSIEGDNLDLEQFTDVFAAISPCWDNKLSEVSHITAIGNIIYTNYPLWLIITSLILLLAMIGSILITIKQ